MSTQFGNGKIVTDGLVLALDAANNSSYPGTGSIWSDLSGNNNNGTLFNSPTFNSGPGSFTFNGTNQYVTSNTGLATGATLHTFSLWVNFITIVSSRWWLAVLGQYNTGGVHWIGTSATGTQFGVYNVNSISPNLLGANQWLNLVSTFNGTTYTIYVNNANPISGIFSPNFTNTTLSLAYPNTGEKYYNGKISQVLVYNRALSVSELTQNYNAQKSRFGLT
jgi:hypothetical protein